MSRYIATVRHFRFGKDGDELVVTTHRDEDFVSRYEWEDEYDTMSEEELQKHLHETMYIELSNMYQSGI